MKVGIIGSGGREHTICEILKKSTKIDKIFCFPGNAGTSYIAQNVNIDPDNFLELVKYESLDRCYSHQYTLKIATQLNFLCN